MTDAQPLLDCFTVHISVYAAGCKPENAAANPAGPAPTTTLG
jgi:hypothetical protein